MKSLRLICVCMINIDSESERESERTNERQRSKGGMGAMGGREGGDGKREMKVSLSLV